MKKLLNILLFIILSLGLIACSKINNPDKICTDLFNEIKAAKGNRLTVYTSQEKLITTGAIIKDIDKEFINVLKNYNFEIKETTIKADKAVVKVKITGVNLGTLTDKYIEEVLNELGDKELLSQINDSEYTKNIENKYLSMLKESKEQERLIEINCIKNSGNWVIEDITKTLDDIFGVKESER